MKRPSAKVRLTAARALTVIAYGAAWALFLTSDLIAVAGPVTAFWPLYLAVFTFVHVKIGYWIGRPAAAWICLVPIVLAIPLARWMPVDPDVPGYPTAVFMVLIFPVMPAASVLTGLGVWFRHTRGKAA